MPTPKLFAIIGTWMEADIIGDTVAHAFVQGCDRVYIVDNASRDDTVARAERAGAILAETYHTSEYEEEVRIGLMNRVTQSISLDDGSDRVWWLWLDADEFVHGSKGRTVRQHLDHVDDRCRVVGARFFNHYPSGAPHYVAGSHPLDLQPLCEELSYPMCPFGHRKHPLQRFDRNEPPITAGLGAHTANCEAPLYEADEPIFMHHFPFRNEPVTRRRLELLCDAKTSGRARGRSDEEPTLHIYARFRSLDAVYRGDWENVENFITEPPSLGVRLQRWDTHVAAEDAVFARAK